MPILDIVCPICTEFFNNSDDVYSTSCGHIFHLSCMEEWKKRESSCPQCRHSNPSTHKLYLSFDTNSDENSKTLKDLELQLKSSNDYNAQLLDQMNETEFNFLHLQEQFTASEEAKKDLQGKIGEMVDVGEDFLRLQGQYTDSLNLIKELEHQKQLLSIANESKSEELKLKCLENDSLKVSLGAAQHNLDASSESDKILILERKLKHLTAVLEKEVTSSTKLSIENIKLQSIIENMKSAEITKHNIPQPTNKKLNLIDNVNDRKNIFKRGQTTPTPTNIPDNNSDANSVLVKGLSELQMNAIPKINIINLGRHMKLKITEKDIVKVCAKENKYNERHNLKPRKINLVVEFRTSELKVEFLKNKEKLKQYSNLNAIEIIDYVSDEVFNLYQYAKILKNHGYELIYWRNNCVYAKKTRSSLCDPILIKTKNDVDILKE